MNITEKTYVLDILKEHGDIAGIMEIFGVKRVGRFGFRKFLTPFITVKNPAIMHILPLEKFPQMVQTAVAKSEAK
ncbi:MAG: hypothetical protein ACJAR8_001885 [Bacteroidia bacterium]|jgi:hypothetical protein